MSSFASSRPPDSADTSIATVAEYFRLGLHVGLLSPSQAIAWADAEIAAAQALPDGLIEVAWSKGLMSTMDALAAVPGERDKQCAGRWLLGLLRQAVPESAEALQAVVRQAMTITRLAEIGDETYFRFDVIDDELSLARSQVYGTVEQCRSQFVAELAAYEPAPSIGRL